MTIVLKALQSVHVIMITPSATAELQCRQRVQTSAPRVIQFVEIFLYNVDLLECPVSTVSHGRISPREGCLTHA